ALPLSHARPDHFFYGATTLGEGLTSLVTASLQYHDVRLPGMTGVASDVVVARIGYVLVSVAALWLGLSMLRCLRAMRHPDAAHPQPAFAGLLTAVTLITPLLAVAAHYVRGVPYPQERTARSLIAPRRVPLV